MVSVGIDVSKGKSTVTITTHDGEIIEMPFDFNHSREGINQLFEKIASYPKEEVRFVMEATGIYHLGILNKLIKEGYFVHLANPLLIKKYFDAVMRKGKTSKKMLLNYRSTRSGFV